MSLKLQLGTIQNSPKNDNDEEGDGTNKSKGQQRLLISGKTRGIRFSKLLQPDSTADISALRRAASHLPPAGLHGELRKCAVVSR